MDPYDKEKTRQIWKRVLGEEEPEDGCAMDSERLRAMIADEKTDACVYRVLARRAGSGGETLEEAEERVIRAAMEKYSGNLSLVAKALDISRPTLYNKLKKYGI